MANSPAMANTRRTLPAMRASRFAIAGAGIMFAAACGVPTQTASTVTVTSTLQPVITNTQPVITSTVTVTYTPPPPPGPKTSIASDGTYQVGVDIVPGTYRTPGGSGCYWARLSSLSTSDIIDNNLSSGPQVVEIQSSDKAFLTKGCTSWQKTS
jgi:hypothetical protein